jgi:hypothetical protein
LRTFFDALSRIFAPEFFALAMPPDGRAWSKLGADFHADDFARYDDFNATILLPACGGTVASICRGILAKASVKSPYQKVHLSR